ncbi:hypothetical protein OG884_08760 [Streptosporangium sp. NBC_01755]|nr:MULTISPECIES: hypothetical protein [unclassified Streptosporangium]WSA26585.1 hypothetical protein OIE13_01400 [Streptosporangium sp. NBC_01810]WSD01991.1 hypothetical protein OG884_08760 [Streptosporangium sp. NBC_01755]
MTSNPPPRAAGQDFRIERGIITMQVVTGRMRLALLFAWVAFTALVLLLT